MKNVEMPTARMRSSWRTMIVALRRVTDTKREKLQERVNKLRYR